MVSQPSPTRILVVDDYPPIADTLEIILRQAGFEVMVAYDGFAAIAAAATFRPDIVLSDYSMPNMNGIDACSQIKKLLPAVRVVLLSGHFMGTDFASPQSLGLNFAVLSKPLSATELLHAIEAETVTPTDSAHPLRVLNVDDVEEHRYSVSRLFTHAGFEVSEAANGTDALRMALESKPDLILLDIHLPDRDGYDVCATLRNNPETARITIVHVTSSAVAADSAQRSANAGADDYIPLPVAPKKLVQRARELMQLRYLEDKTH